MSTQLKSAKRDTEARMNQLLVCMNIVFWFVSEIDTAVIWKKEHRGILKIILTVSWQCWRCMTCHSHMFALMIEISDTDIVDKCQNSTSFLSVFILALSFSDNSSSWDNYQSGESLHFSTTIVIRNLFYWAMWDDTSSYYFLDMFQQLTLLCVSEPVPSSPSCLQVDVAPTATWAALSSPHKWRSPKM